MFRCAKPLFLAAGVALLASPATAQSDEPAATRQPDARDVAMTPLTDLNLTRDEIPPILLAAVADPYEAEGLHSCEQIEGVIAMLDAALGPDMDIHEDDRDRISWGKIATSAVGSFIPFRSVLRELTGAADHKRDLQAAIYAGAVRRGFLKGLGQQKDCAYPARPAFTRVAAVEVPARRVRGKASVPPTAPPAAAPPAQAFISAPVVQSLPKAGARR
jgi:hypothetical protein